MSGWFTVDVSSKINFTNVICLQYSRITSIWRVVGGTMV